MEKKRTLHLYPTMKCQLNCDYCYVNSVNVNHTELPMNEYEKLLKEAKELNVNTVDIAGGEPLLYKNTIPLLRECKKNTYITKLVTNGLFLEKYMDNTKPDEKLIDELHVSVDSDLPEIHDRIRKHKGLHEILCHSIKRYVEEQYGKIVINYVLEKESASRIENILDFAYGLGVNGIDIQYIANVSFKTQKNDFSLSVEKILDSLKQIAQWHQNNTGLNILISLPGYVYVILRSKEELMKKLSGVQIIYSHGITNDNYFSDTIIVRNDGWVTGSTSMINSMEWMIGNIMDQSIKEIWNYKKDQAIKKIKDRSKKLVSDGICKDCIASRFCRGGDPVEFADLSDFCHIRNELKIEI